MQDLKAHLLTAPDSQLDNSVFPLIEKWNEPTPTGLQILEVVDHCIGFGLCSGFVLAMLQAMLEQVIENENTTREALWAQADLLWRKDMYAE